MNLKGIEGIFEFRLILALNYNLKLDKRFQIGHSCILWSIYSIILYSNQLLVIFSSIHWNQNLNFNRWRWKCRESRERGLNRNCRWIAIPIQEHHFLNILYVIIWTRHYVLNRWVHLSKKLINVCIIINYDKSVQPKIYNKLTKWV